MIAGDPEGGGLVARKVLEGHGNNGTWLVSRLGRSHGQDLAENRSTDLRTHHLNTRLPIRQREREKGKSICQDRSKTTERFTLSCVLTCGHFRDVSTKFCDRDLI